ncbi:hypothetical protein P167DRAFT_544445 [Morchella conica CCBAS932]|uniref:Uncharacterized protein n=1 Tax=Morchella conica CCBAS932 TaxID=1392247 RepID=A0A3N4KWH5_9PEZI|nr:hypothetical protein P167DRAFT_544445 [Morchella conica CCBAS932]
MHKAPESGVYIESGTFQYSRSPTDGGSCLMVLFAVICPWHPYPNSVIGLKSLTAVRQDPPSPRENIVHRVESEEKKASNLKFKASQRMDMVFKAQRPCMPRTYLALYQRGAIALSISALPYHGRVCAVLLLGLINKASPDDGVPP